MKKREMLEICLIHNFRITIFMKSNDVEIEKPKQSQALLLLLSLSIQFDLLSDLMPFSRVRVRANASKPLEIVIVYFM